MTPQSTTPAPEFVVCAPSRWARLERVAPYAIRAHRPDTPTAPHPSFLSPRAAAQAPSAAPTPVRTKDTAGERSPTGGSASQRPSAARPTPVHAAYRGVASERTACWTVGESALNEPNRPGVVLP